MTISTRSAESIISTFEVAVCEIDMFRSHERARVQTGDKLAILHLIALTAAEHKLCLNYSISPALSAKLWTALIV